MTKNKIISLILIIIGLLLSITGTIRYLSKNEKDNVNKPNEEIKMTPEEIVASWIGTYENSKENNFYVIFENYDTAQVMVLKDGFDMMYEVSDITYEQLNIKSEKSNGVVKRENETLNLLIETNDENKDKLIEQSFKKIENDNWTGMYIKNEISIFITRITDSFLYVSFADKKNKTATLGLVYYNSSDTENTSGHYISDEKIKYKTENDDTFTITRDGENINVEYSGDNSSLNMFNGTFKRYKK